MVNPVLSDANASGTSWTTTTALTPGQTYEWYVGAVSTNGMTTIWSAGQTFTLTALASSHAERAERHHHGEHGL